MNWQGGSACHPFVPWQLENRSKEGQNATCNYKAIYPTEVSLHSDSQAAFALKPFNMEYFKLNFALDLICLLQWCPNFLHSGPKSKVFFFFLFPN